MRNLISLDLKDYVSYKRATLDLDYVGVTVIKGKNLNVKRGTDNTNGSGKSLLVSAIPQILLSSSSLVAGSRSAKTSFSPTTNLGLSYENQGELVALARTHKGINLNINGKDMTARTQAQATEQLSELMPLSEDEFFTTTYLDSRRPFLLQMGTAANRHAFISQLFRLSDFDAVRAAVNTEIRSLQKSEIERDTLSAQLANAISSLPDIDFKESKARYKSEYKKLGALSNRLTELSSEAQYVTNLTYLESRLESSIRESISLGFKGNTATELLPQAIQESKRCAALHDSLLEYANHQRQLGRYDKERIRIDKAIADLEVQGKDLELDLLSTLPMEDRVKALRQRIKDSDRLVSQQEEVGRKIKGLVAKMRPLKEAINDPSNSGLDGLDLDLDLDAIESQMLESNASIQGLSKSLTHLAGHADKGGRCSSCRSDLTVKQVGLLIEETESNLRAAQKDYKRAKLRKKQFGDREALQDMRAEFKRLSKELKAAKAERLALEGQTVSDSEESLIEALVAALYDKQKLSVPKWGSEIPKPTEGDLDLGALSERKELVSSAVAELRSLSKLEADSVEFVEWLNGRDLTVMRAKIDEERTEVNAKVSLMHRELPTLRANLIEFKKTRDRIKELEEQVGKLNAELKNLPIFKLLFTAYSNNGLKTVVAQRLVERVQDNMNTYSSLLFPEPFEFEFNLAGASKFDILAIRKSGRKHIISDVRYLSGAESRAFSLLSLLSLLPLIPAGRRFNILVLDEMTSNMDPMRAQLFINEFLPVLNTVVPHIIIVTPDDDIYPMARTFIATKKGTESRLIKSDL